jgi:hypothetical protein
MWRNIERDSFPFCTSFLRQIQRLICQDIWGKRQHMPNEKGVISPKSLPTARFLPQNDSSRNKEETLWQIRNLASEANLNKAEDVSSRF